MRSKKKPSFSAPPNAVKPGAAPHTSTNENLDVPAGGAASLTRLGTLYLLVFISGAVLMGLEIIGSRLLAPHFGNSIFVWGSLISVFLAALAFGYFLGGRLADLYPFRHFLDAVCIAASFLIFVSGLLAHPVAAWLVDHGFGEQSGPLLASIALFLLPSATMGIVSPLSIRIATRSMASVGRISGMLYSLSTLGSIVGTLLTTFLLIPHFGARNIVNGLALTLFLVTIGTTPFWRRTDSLVTTIVLMVGALFLSQLSTDSEHSDDRGEIIASIVTPYHNITVSQTGGARHLCFDKYVESSIDVFPPYPSLARYTDYFHLAFLADQTIDRALFIGAGGGIGPRTFSRHDPNMNIDVVDIDPQVLEVASKHFFFELTPQISTIANDGRMYLRKTKNQYDCIVLDAFTIGGRIPFHLVTKEFFELCHHRMTDKSVLIININSSLEGANSRIFGSIYRTLESVFDATYVFAADHQVYSKDVSRNIILVATKGVEKMSSEQWQANCDQYWSKSYITRERLQSVVKDLVVSPPNPSESTQFTDDFAPIEMMPF